MERLGFRVVIGLFLVALGVLVLLSNLNVVPWDITTMQWFWLLAFGGVGVIFLGVFVNNRENWWAIIPSFTLLGLAVLVSNIFHGRWEEVGPAVFLGMIGLSFWVIFAVRREFWWAVIPGGVLVSLGVGLATTSFMQGDAFPVFFFFGLALTFLAVYLIPFPQGRMTWALWPASILGALGIFLSLEMSSAARFIGPAALILLGGWIVLRTTRKQ